MEDSLMTSATIRRTLTIGAIAIGLAIVSAPVFAQTGQIKGKVVDAQGNPVDGAKIALYNLNTNRTLETKTKKNGEYIQVGLTPSKYRVTASKGDLTETHEIDIHLDMATLDFKLTGAGGAGAGMSKEEAAKAKAKGEAMNKAFSEGVELSNAGKTDEAVAKFNEVIAAKPDCAECYANIGTVQAKAKKYDEAEAAYKKAVEVNPKFAEGYNGLANLYNAQKKFDLAAEASQKAMELSNAAGAAGGAAGGAGGGNASGVFNQGVILWNAGKIPEAKAQFEQAVKLDPNLADAHYWLGMALVNAGTPEAMAEAKPHFETYLKLAPTGQYADTAKGIVASIK
jgi:tetratricopeptide (TPR) repeat protein